MNQAETLSYKHFPDTDSLYSSRKSRDHQGHTYNMIVLLQTHAHAMTKPGRKEECEQKLQYRSIPSKLRLPEKAGQAGKAAWYSNRQVSNAMLQDNREDFSKEVHREGSSGNRTNGGRGRGAKVTHIWVVSHGEVQHGLCCRPIHP